MDNSSYQPSGVNDGQYRPDFLPSAPPLEGLDLPPGYEAATYGDDASLAPPPYESLYPSGNPNRHIDTQLSSVTEEEAKFIFVEFAEKKCCYGTKTARELTVTNVQNTSAYHYILKSLGEARTAAWKFEPYKGQAIPPYSYIPRPWDVPVPLPSGFMKDKKKIRIAETQTVKVCHKCNGTGRHRCGYCHGMGRESCSFCNGSGRSGIGSDSTSCTSCSGMGRKSCTWCHGTGTVTCTICHGHKQLLHFIQLTVKWKPYEDHHVVERTELPPKLIKKVSGDTVFQEEKPMVQPLTEFWDAEVNSGSAALFNKHLQETTSEQRIVRQNHCVRVVPVTEVNYMWRDKLNKFFIYGLERKIYVQNYPQRCCCCCSVL